MHQIHNFHMLLFLTLAQRSLSKTHLKVEKMKLVRHCAVVIFTCSALVHAQASAQELMVAKSKAGDVWVWEMTDSKFDLSRLEIRRKSGLVERHIGSAPLMGGMISASPRPATSQNEKVPDFPLRGDYKAKIAGSGMNLSYSELRCARNCSPVEKELVFRPDSSARLTWTAQ